MTLIEVKGLYKGYDEKAVLKNINIQVKKGEALAIIGPTGAGKTTLLRLLNLLERPASGEIYFDGIDTNNQPGKIKLNLRRRMAMVFQKPVVFDTSVFDNVAYGLKVRGKDKTSRDENVESALEMVGLSGYENRSAPTLSGGEVQRVALARAMVTEPEVLLLDEPTANLDAKSVDVIEELVSRIIHEYNTTVIMATHDMSQGRRLADWICVLMKGEIMQVGTPYEIFNKPQNEDIADFVGVENILSGVVRNNENGVAEIVVDMDCNIFAVSPYQEGKVKLFIRPEDIILSESMGESSARNVIRAKIEELRDLGPLTRVRMDDSLVALITKQSRESLGLRKGDEVYATFKATSVHVVR